MATYLLVSNDFIVLICSFKSSPVQHDVYLVNLPPIQRKIDDTAGYVFSVQTWEGFCHLTLTKTSRHVWCTPLKEYVALFPLTWCNEPNRKTIYSLITATCFVHQVAIRACSFPRDTTLNAEYVQCPFYTKVPSMSGTLWPHLLSAASVVIFSLLPRLLLWCSSCGFPDSLFHTNETT